MKKASYKAPGKSGKSSAVIRPGTGSGSRPNGGSTKTPTSNPTEQHHLHRSPKNPLK